MLFACKKLDSYPMFVPKAEVTVWRIHTGTTSTLNNIMLSRWGVKCTNVIVWPINRLSLNPKSKSSVCDNASPPLSVFLSPTHPCLIHTPLHFPPVFFFPPSILSVPSSLSFLCLGNEKEESMSCCFVPAKGVEWKSIHYLKTRGLQNNTETHK